MNCAFIFYIRRNAVLKAGILVVDDSAVSTQIIKDILEQDDYSVTTSNDGKGIIDLIETQKIDIVLLDIVMPEISGYELLKILQDTESTKDIPVVMLTSLTSPLEVKKALEYGAMDFIRKTSEPIEVIARVNSALRLKHKQDQLKQNAQRDHLTQLYNKQFFNGVLEKLIKDKADYYKGIALLMLDLDYFKKINDHYGHMTGDNVLAAIANAIVKSIKSTDIACRFGGEEFCVLCPNTTQFQAYAIAERIRANVGKIPFNFQGETFTVTTSCGISHMRHEDNKSSLRLVNESDLALYQAKNNGRNQTVLFTEDKEVNISFN